MLLLLNIGLPLINASLLLLNITIRLVGRYSSSVLNCTVVAYSHLDFFFIKSRLTVTNTKMVILNFVA